MAKKSKFARTYRSLTDIGREFNLSAIKTGSELKRLGHRNQDGTPTQKSLDDGLAVFTPLKDGTPYYRWNFSKCRAILGKCHGPDRLKEIRRILKEMLSVYRSDSWKVGGGLEYKLAEYEFFELVKSLPIEKELDDILSLIGELRSDKDAKSYFEDVVFTHLSSCCKPTTAQMTVLFNRAQWIELSCLSENMKVDEFTRKRALNDSVLLRNR